MEELFNDEAIICIGAGASLTGFDFSKLERFRQKIIIGSNQLFKYYNKIDHLIIIDYPYFEQEYDNLREYQHRFNITKSHSAQRLHLPTGFLHCFANSRVIQEKLMYPISLMPMWFFKEFDNYENYNAYMESLGGGYYPNQPFKGELSGLSMLSLGLQICEERNVLDNCNLILLGYDFFGGHFYNPDDILFTDRNEAIRFMQKTDKLIKEFPELRDRIFNVNKPNDEKFTLNTAMFLDINELFK